MTIPAAPPQQAPALPTTTPRVPPPTAAGRVVRFVLLLPALILALTGWLLPGVVLVALSLTHFDPYTGLMGA